MKKQLVFFLITLSLSLSVFAEVKKISTTINDIKLDLTYELQKTNSVYEVKGSITTPTAKTCDFVGSVAEKGNSSTDGLSKTCGDYIVRVDSVNKVKTNPVQGYSFQLVVEVDYYGSKKYQKLGEKAFEMGFIEAQTLELKSPSTLRLETR